MSSLLLTLERTARCLVLAGASYACLAHAQDDGPADDGRRTAELPVIIVTPEWQPVDQQRVPKTIVHLAGEQLANAGIHDTIDLQYAAPGFVFKTNAVLGQPYLRGVGSDFISAGAESSVATFVDGVYLPRAYDSIADLFDLERVEIIKGPQAVHLGRNVVGGAVSIVTASPSRDGSAGYVDVEAGSHSRARLRGALNVPLERAPIAIRIAGAMASRDGYMHNAVSGSDSNDEGFDALRVKMLYEPSDTLSLLLAAERRTEDSSRATSTKPMPLLGVNGGIEMGGIVPEDPRATTENVAPAISGEAERYSAQVRWTGETTTLLATSAYVQSGVRLSLDLDGTDADFSSNHPSGTSRALMQEVRVSALPRGPWSWTAGVFLLDEQANQSLDVRLPQSGTRNRPDADVATRSYAVFGEGALELGSGVRLRLGARYTQDARELDLVRTVEAPAGTTVLTQNEHGRWDGVTPEIGVEYSPREDRLWFATVARGFKAGGFNTSTIQAAFDPEWLTAYETGVKATLAERRIRLAAAAFYYDYEDLQLNTPPAGAPPGTFPRVINAAESSVRGIDVDLELRALDGALALGLGATLLDAEFDDFVSADPNNPAVDPDRAGNRMPQAPELSLNLRADYTWSLPQGELTLKGEYRRQSAVYYNIYEDPALREGGYGLVNAALAFALDDARWFVEAYGRNLTDELYAQTIVRNDPLGGTKRLWAAPRTFGVRFGYRW